MNATHSKSAFVYGQVRRALQSGRYVPGQRIDPAKLAEEFKTSPTPVRFALYRLVGEGLVDDHARNGLHVPLLTEVALRDLYDWMEGLLLWACNLAAARPSSPHPMSAFAAGNDDLVNLTWELFDAIASATDRWSLHHAVKRANDQLTPVRRANLGLIQHAHEELRELISLWQNRNIADLRDALIRYHQRRKQVVPRIVAMLGERSEHLH